MRAPVLLCVGAALIAGAALVATSESAPAKRAATRAVPESLQVLVRLGKSVITRGDVQKRLDDLPEQFRANYTTPEGRQQLIDRMIEEKVWLLASERAGVAARPQVQRQIEQQRRDLLIRTYLNELMSANPAPSDSEAKAYYDSHLAEYRMPATATVRHIQLKTEADAKRVLPLARAKGADWDKLVTRYSTDSLTRSTGGQLGAVTREGTFPSIGRQPALAESIFAAGEGRIGGPWKSDKAWHLVKIESLRPESERPFDQVRPMIQRQLSSTRQQDYYRAKLEEAKRTLGVSTDSGAVRRFVSQKKTARDLFREAQEAGPAATRIELYRKLLAEYPNDEVSAQAQFMIGFIQSEELKDYDAAEGTFHELLSRYGKSELVPSAQWMLEHMRSEDAPAFLNLEADSAQAPARPGGKATKPKP